MAFLSACARSLAVLGIAIITKRTLGVILAYTQDDTTYYGSDHELNTEKEETRRSAVDTVLLLPELHEMILSHIPAIPLYRAREVCKTWRDRINQSHNLQRIMFRRSEENAEQGTSYEYSIRYRNVCLSAPTLTLNPTLRRVIVVPEGDDSFLEYAMLGGKWRNQAISQAFTEDLLDCESTALAESPPRPKLVDEVKRPLRFLSDPEGEVMVTSNLQKDVRGHKRLDSAWKSMLFCQPPINKILLKHPRKSGPVSVTNSDGNTMLDILFALQGLYGLGEWTRRRKRGVTIEEVDIVLPIFDESGAEVRDELNMRMHRALKTKLKVRLESCWGGECGKPLGWETVANHIGGQNP